MKTYYLDVIQRIRRFSEQFNVITTLCDKTWVVFSDIGEREVYIFKPDGTIYITNDGVGIKGKWEWISENKSLIINKDGNVIMLHPEFVDNTVLALTLDGTSEMAFLIEQGDMDAFEAKTLSQLEQYFIDKENHLIAEDKNIREELESLREYKRKNEEKLLKKDAKKLQDKIEWSVFRSPIGIILCLMAFLYIVLSRYMEDKYNMNSLEWYWLAIIIMAEFISFVLIFGYFFRILYKKKRDHWIEEHPDDPRNKYLE